MTLWHDLGFRENPYSTKPISGNENGEKLLVGREKELRKLVKHLSSSDTHPTLEGENGVGKTSLISVASYRLKNSWVKGENTQAIIPLESPFQIDINTDLLVFKKSVFFRIAQAFIDNHQNLKEKGFSVPDISAIKEWLNSPLMVGASAGFSSPVAGFSGGKTKAANTSSGFTEAGFIETVTRWLSDCFPSSSSGAFVCVIDNLELVETSKKARNLIESLRDELLGIRGLKWVLCGARGIIRSTASSQRLQGVLSEPIILRHIPDDLIQDLIKTRIDFFKNLKNAVAPVEPLGFEHLYNVGNKNLRNALKYSEDFSLWVDLEDLEKQNPSEKFQLLEAWMAELSDDYLLDTRGVGERAWQVFDQLVQTGGITSPGEFKDFGFSSNTAMKNQLLNLESAQLIDSAIDDTDSRRRTITITSRGWIVNYRRSGYSQIGSTL